MVATLVSIAQLLPGLNVSHLRQEVVQRRSAPSSVRLAVARLLAECSTACSVAQGMLWQCETVQLRCEKGMPSRNSAGSPLSMPGEPALPSPCLTLT